MSAVCSTINTGTNGGHGAIMGLEHNSRHCTWVDREHPIKYVPSVVQCFVVMESSIDMESCETFIHILQGFFTGIGAIVWLPQCQRSNPDEYGYNLALANNNRKRANGVCLLFGMHYVLSWLLSLKKKAPHCWLFVRGGCWRKIKSHKIVLLITHGIRGRTYQYRTVWSDRVQLVSGDGCIDLLSERWL